MAIGIQVSYRNKKWLPVSKMSREFQDGYRILRWLPEFNMATGIKNDYPYPR